MYVHTTYIRSIYDKWPCLESQQRTNLANFRLLKARLRFSRIPRMPGLLMSTSLPPLFPLDGGAAGEENAT